MRLLPLALLAPIFLLACTPPPPKPPPPEPAPELALAERACANLATLGCPEATLAKACAPVLLRASELHDLHPACIAAARDVLEVRACAVRCGGLP